MSLDLKSVKPFKTKDEYLYAMKEDLAEWFHDLYGLPTTVDSFFEHLDSGTLLCRHANTVQNHMSLSSDLNSNESMIVYKSNAQPGTFQARDNISIFIGWCRKVLEIPDTLIFETEDLVVRKNERNVVLCILEVARKGAKFGVLAPQLIQLEQEIDAEIERENNSNSPLHEKTSKVRNHRSVLDNSESTRKKEEKNHIAVDMMSLDEMVRLILSRCKCEHQYPMIRLSEGKYTYGNNLTPVFLRVLRRHVMVRTGGGWDTLESFLDRHDPCRCNSKEHRGALAFRNQSKYETPTKPQTENDAKSTSTISQTTSIESMPASNSSLTEDKYKSSTRPINLCNETDVDGIPDESNTLSLLNDVVSLIEKKQPTAADTHDTKPTNTSANKIKDRPKSCKNIPSNKTKSVNQVKLGSINRKLNVNVNHSKAVALNSKSLTSSRENLLINKTSSRRKSDFSGINEAKKAKGDPEASSVNKNKSKLKAVGNATPNKMALPCEIKLKDTKSSCKKIQVSSSKSLNSSCENLFSSNRRKSECIPIKNMTPSRSLYAYNNLNDAVTRTSVKKPSNNHVKSQSASVPRRPASARTHGLTNNEKSKSSVRKALNFSNCSQSLENLTEDISILQHFQSHDSVTHESVSKSKPRKDITDGSKTRIPAPMTQLKYSDTSLRRTDSGVDITGETVPQKNTFFDDDDYY